MQEELTYEQAMQQLETIASQMEHGNIGVDELADKLSQAQQLMKFCHNKLYEAEKSCNSLLNVSEKE